MKKFVAFHSPETKPTISHIDDSQEEEIEEPTEVQMRYAIPGSHATRSHIISVTVPAVQLKNVYKHYGMCQYWRQVLASFSMTVMPGEIYTLIGPKGCGKTTVLNIILGLETVDQGDVMLFGFNPRHKYARVYGGKVGYMPEKPGLHLELTIIETLVYYSTILGLEEEYASIRINFLLKLLSLAKEKKLIGKLSEGQRQRVSFAIAVLHEPKILLLDEPTSTADPILRHSIWLHLHNMSSMQETAVIVTTHYVEEGRQSHRVGIIRNGRILADDDPNILIDKFAAYSLESVIYTLIAMEMDSSKFSNQAAMSLSLSPDDIKMCEEHIQKHYGGAGSTIRTQIASVVDLLLDRQDYKYPHFNEVVDGIVMRCQALRCPSVRRSRAILNKDLKIILRNYLKLLRALTFPWVFILIFCLTIGPMPKNLLFGVVNKEVTPDTCKDQPKEYTSCRYLANIDSEIIQQEIFADEKKASAAAMRSQVRGVIVIGKNFSSAFEDKIWKDDDEPISDGNVKVAIYETDVQTKFVVHDALLYALDALLEEMREEYGNHVDRADSLIQITGPVHNDRHVTHTYFMAPGLVICFTFYQAAAALTLSLIRERLAKQMDRNYVAGAANVEIVASHIITYVPLILAHMGLLLVSLFFILNVPLRGKVFEVINLMLMQGIAGIAFGHVISYVCATELQGMKVILCACFLSIVFCGIVWPITVMPTWMQKTVSIFPQTEASSELRKAITCGSIYKLGLFKGLTVPATWVVILFAISSVLHIYK